MLLKRCRKCRWRYDRNDKWHYHYMRLTDWLPSEGVEQRLREFKCSYCGNVEYLVLSVKEFERMGVYRFI